MKGRTLIISVVSFILFCSCSKSTSSKPLATCYTGILKAKGPCGQVLIEITSADKRGLQYDPSWENPQSGEKFQNVFAVKNPCEFPATIQTGDSITFKVQNDNNRGCDNCRIFTPEPSQHMNILIGCTDNK